MDMDALEAIIVDTFLEKHDLQPVWVHADGAWGSKDENGVFNGVVGKVSNLFRVISYFKCLGWLL